METTEIKQGRSYGNIGVLDIRKATEESVEGVRVGNVGTLIYSPETAHLISRITIGNLGSSIEVPGDAKFINGHVTFDRDCFKNSGSPTTLFINGHLIVEPDVPAEDIESGLGGVIMNGHILYPEHLAGVVQSKIRYINGHSQSYAQGDRLLTGRVKLDEVFLRSLDDGTNLAVVGRLNMPEVLPNELLERKIQSIKARGRIQLHEENSEVIFARLGDSLGHANITVIPAGYRLIDGPVVIDDIMFNALTDRRLYCADLARVDPDVSPALLNEKLDAIAAQGIVICPASLRDVLSAKLDMTQTRAVFYEGELWLIEDEMELVASRFDFLDGRATIVNTGELVIDSNIEPKVLADRLVKVHNLGEISCTREQMGAIQARLGLSEGEITDSSWAVDSGGGNAGHLAL